MIYTGIFTGSIALNGLDTPVSGDGHLTVRDGDTITAYYSDARNAAGNPVLATSTATVDTDPPQLLVNAISNLDDQSAKLTLVTSEPTQVVAKFGTSCGSADVDSVATSAFETTHTIQLSQLTPLTDYFYNLVLTDRAGNQSI